MSAEKINLIVNMTPASISEMKDALDPTFHSMAMFKALELARHHARFQLLLPYNGGRSETMLMLEQDTVGQAPDAGEPLAQEAAQLSDEMVAAIAEAKAKAEAGTVIDDETDFLVNELASEVIEFCEENDDGEETTSDVDDDSDGEDEETVAAKKDSAYSDEVDAEEECTELCRGVLAGLTKGLLESTNMDTLTALTNIALNDVKEYTWAAGQNGVVTFILTK